jgi:transcriptional regulator with XRE-family HTH domain
VARVARHANIDQMAILTYVFRSNKVFNMDTCTSQPITVERGSSAARRDAATRMAKSRDNPLGKFLQDRRAKLDPTAFGFEATHRRTPGLRREEIALRARISPTWYTWLEQGRGGVPSADVLDRIACAFALAPVEREHLFLLAQRRLPEVRYRAPGCVTPRLQRMLDALEFSPAFVKTPTWDVLAWNRAAALVLTDYAALAPEERNVLRLLFCNTEVRANIVGWESNARLAVAAFRRETARAGATEKARKLVEELSRSSPEFAAMWVDNGVCGLGEGTQHLKHASAGPLVLEYSTFTVDDRPDLALMIYTPATPADRARVRTLVAV